jgi:uncharacterized protein
MKTKATFILLGILIISIILSVLSLFIQTSNRESYVKIKDAIVYVEIADSPEKKYQGLSDRASMPQDRGMLFIFPGGNNGAFEMRRMRFPLDIIWIKDLKIAKLDKNLPPPYETNNVPVIVYSPGSVQHVLEVNAGWSDQNNIGVGDEVQIVIY